MFGGKLRLDQPDSFIDRRQHNRLIETRDAMRAISAGVSGVSFGPSPSTKRQRLSERKRNDQNIGKHDRRIETESADRLQRYLGGKLRREAQIEKAPAFFRFSRYSGR